MNRSIATRSVHHRAIACTMLFVAGFVSPAFAQQAREAWGTDQCHYVAKAGQWVRSGYCRTFVAGNGALWNLHLASDASRTPLVQLNFSHPGWIYSFQYGTKQQFRFVNRGSIFFGAPNETFLQDNGTGQWRLAGNATAALAARNQLLALSDRLAPIVAKQQEEQTIRAIYATSGYVGGTTPKVHAPQLQAIIDRMNNHMNRVSTSPACSGSVRGC